MQKSQALKEIYILVFYVRSDLMREGLEFFVAYAVEGTVTAQVSTILFLKAAGAAYQMLEKRHRQVQFVLERVRVL